MRIQDFIGETTIYDKKLCLEVANPKSWLKSVSAFANGEGGKLIFGIDDNDNVIGLKTYKEDSEIISETIKQHMDPIPKFSLSFESVSNESKIIILDIAAGSETPYYFKDKNNQISFMRVGNESVPCDYMMMNSLILKGIGKSYDSITSKYKITDFSFDTLINSFKKVRDEEITLIDLQSLELVEGDYLTNAGVLLVDNCPLRQSRIFATRWNGLDKGENALDSIELEHLSLIELLHKGVEFIDKHNNKGWIKESFGRKEYVSYPKRAVFEGLCNALIHRDYLEVGSEVHIDIFDDRLEIYSPGGMAEGGNIQDKDILYIKSKRRNPIIADIFGRLEYIERRGSGFKKILKDYSLCSCETTPKFLSDVKSFTLTLKNTQYKPQTGALSGTVSGPVSGTVSGPVSIKDILNNKVHESEYNVNVDSLPGNRKYDNQIMLLCLKPRNRRELQKLLNISSSPYMKSSILKPLIENEYLCLTNPERINSKNQKYYTNPKYIFKKN